MLSIQRVIYHVVMTPCQPTATELYFFLSYFLMVAACDRDPVVLFNFASPLISLHVKGLFEIVVAYHHALLLPTEALAAI